MLCIVHANTLCLHTLFFFYDYCTRIGLLPFYAMKQRLQRWGVFVRFAHRRGESFEIQLPVVVVGCKKLGMQLVYLHVCAERVIVHGIRKQVL